MSLPENLPAVVEQMLIQNQQNGSEMARLVSQMAQIAAGLDRRLRMLEEQLSQKVTISHDQAKRINAAMKDRSLAICEKYSLDARACAGTIKAAIQKDFKKQYSIADAHDLPACYYELALSMIREWSSFALVRKIRDKQSQCG
ncbi:MAG: ORF6C domain-containing protein [Clostridia bacterium]|nr:ORF6C domain-containing protein [Clostridia bacterium]